MKIDLFKLNNLGSCELNGEVTFDKEMFGTMDILDIKDVQISGELSIDYEDNVNMYGRDMPIDLEFIQVRKI